MDEGGTSSQVWPMVNLVNPYDPITKLSVNKSQSFVVGLAIVHKTLALKAKQEEEEEEEEDGNEDVEILLSLILLHLVW